MIVRSWEGLRTKAIAEELGCHPQTVRERFHRFNAQGIDGLGDLPGAGRKARITESERSRIIAFWWRVILLGGWSVAVAANSKPEMSAKQPIIGRSRRSRTPLGLSRGIVVGGSQVRRILRAEGVRWRNTRPWAESEDP